MGVCVCLRSSFLLPSIDLQSVVGVPEKKKFFLLVTGPSVRGSDRLTTQQSLGYMLKKRSLLLFCESLGQPFGVVLSFFFHPSVGWFVVVDAHEGNFFLKVGRTLTPKSSVRRSCQLTRPMLNRNKKIVSCFLAGE